MTDITFKYKLSHMFLFGSTQHIIDTVNYKDIITTRKRSLGHGNVFESVCQSFYSQGGLCMMSLPVWLPGPRFLEGVSLCLAPCSFRGVCVKGLCEGGYLKGDETPSTDI